MPDLEIGRCVHEHTGVECSQQQEVSFVSVTVVGSSP